MREARKDFKDALRTSDARGQAIATMAVAEAVDRLAGAILDKMDNISRSMEKLSNSIRARG